MLTTDCHKNVEIFNVYVSHERRKGRIGVELLNGDKTTLASVKFVLAQKIQPSVYFIYDKVFSSTLSLLISQQSNDFEDKCISSWLVLTHIGTEIFKIFHIPTGSFVEFPDKNVFSQCKLRVSRFLCMYFSLNFIPFVWSLLNIFQREEYFNRTSTRSMSRKHVDIQNPLLLPSWCVQNIFHLNRVLSRTNRAKRER